MRWLKAIIEKELYSDSQGLTKEHITGLVNHCQWLKAIIEKELYSDSQGLTKEHITGLVNHCQKSIDYLSSLITSKRNQYHHFQVMLITLIAVLIAVVSLVIGILK